ncbi:MAG: sigma-70 family RNA polymerase sigma factor [Myxococcales bacterium]
MTDFRSLTEDRQQGRERFLELVAEVRPELHRYCARMTGSVADGEDLVQETLARAYYGLSELESLPALRPWLFRIAHSRAIDHLRRYDRRMGRPLEVVHESVADGAADPEQALSQDQAVHAAISVFVELPPAQRSAVILKDVLGHSLDDIAELLELSLPAVKAALHRGRARLRQEQEAAESNGPAKPSAPSPVVARYARLFNARDWEGVRALLAEDVRLDLVSRARRSGREVESYTSNYATKHDWHMVPAMLEGREVIAVFRRAEDMRPGYFVELTLVDERVALIRDFRYVPYIAREAVIELSAERGPWPG